MRTTKYPISELEVGDSFYVNSANEQIAVLLKIARHKKSNPKKHFYTKKDKTTGKIEVVRDK